MRRQNVLTACLLLLWTLTAFVNCDKEDPDITVKNVLGGIKLHCKSGDITYPNRSVIAGEAQLKYHDDNTGLYSCGDSASETSTHIFVKFRTCDNCVEFNEASIAGLVIGNVVATTVVAVAVYLVASQAQIGPVSSHKKSSDRHHLVPNEISNRAANDHYQPLKRKNDQKDMYDVLQNRK
ncbi:hypothetical protein PAMA_020759 [Pampus argenteus]